MQSVSNTEALGLRRGMVEVVPYDSRWPLIFEDTAAKLRAALGRSILAVHHVGSTSVPNLSAEPVLDVLVAVPDFDQALQLVPDIEALGYVFRRDAEIEDRHYFRRVNDTARTHHLSLATPTSRHYIDTLAFRDELRSNANLASEYEELKLALARAFPRDRESYVNGKTNFVVSVLRSVGGSDRDQLGSNNSLKSDAAKPRTSG
jgi:GrpB-like predicted nucleotidyltransferase (UPF0157 family)